MEQSPSDKWLTRPASDNGGVGFRAVASADALALRAALAAVTEALRACDEFFYSVRRITTKNTAWEMLCSAYPEQVHREVAAALARAELLLTHEKETT